MHERCTLNVIKTGLKQLKSVSSKAISTVAASLIAKLISIQPSRIAYTHCAETSAATNKFPSERALAVRSSNALLRLLLLLRADGNRTIIGNLEVLARTGSSGSLVVQLGRRVKASVQVDAASVPGVKVKVAVSACDIRSAEAGREQRLLGHFTRNTAAVETNVHSAQRLPGYCSLAALRPHGVA